MNPDRSGPESGPVGVSRWTVQCRRGGNGWLAEVPPSTGRSSVAAGPVRAATLHALRPEVLRRLRSAGAGADFEVRYRVPGEPLLQRAIDLAAATAPLGTRSGRIDRRVAALAHQLLERGMSAEDLAGALNVTPELVLNRFWGALRGRVRQSVPGAAEQVEDRSD